MFELAPFVRRGANVRSYDPFYAMEQFERNFFNDSIGSFHTDIREENDHFLIEADLPGFRKEDINLDINGDTLTISAQRNAEKEQKDDKGNYIRRERSWGSFARSFDISAVDAQNIKAAYTDGVLTLTLPKKTAVPPTARRLEIE